MQWNSTFQKSKKSNVCKCSASAFQALPNVVEVLKSPAASQEISHQKPCRVFLSAALQFLQQHLKVLEFEWHQIHCKY